MAIIYGLENTVTGYVYVGCTSGNMAKRLREHRCLLRKKRHSVGKLQEDWIEHGESAFVMKALERFECESVMHKRARELYWMQEFSIKGKLYNANQQSFTFSKEAWRKGVDKSAQSDHRKSEVFRQRQLGVIQNTLLTPENRAGNAKRMKDRWSDPAFRAKMHEALARGRAKTNARCRPRTKSEDIV